VSEEVLVRLRRLYQYAAALQGLMESVRASAPRAAQGNDPTGSVHVAIGPDGLPTRIRVEDGWQRRIDPETLSDAVLAAFTAATAHGMDAWSQTLERISWQSRVEDLTAEARAQGEPRPVPDVPTHGPPRDAQYLTEEALNTLTSVRGQAAAGPAACVGSSAGGNISLVLSPAGLQACSVSPEWLSQQDVRSLNAALDQALSAAREELNERMSRRRSGDLDDLASEALAALKHIRTVSEEPKGR
jgi:DNA-binding protein YbaB